MDKTTRLVGLGSALLVGGGTAVALFWLWWWSRRQRRALPKNWRKVGELSDLVCFPVKSLGPVKLSEMEATQLGLKVGWMRDRTLMLIDLEGKFVTARQIPKMLQVSPSYSGSVLTLNAPGMLSYSLDLATVNPKRAFCAAVWGQPIAACDCGEEAARWLSRFLLQEDTGLRLVYYPLEKPRKPMRESHKVFPKVDYGDLGAYPDATSYTLQNEASIAELNGRINGTTVSTAQFRGNFLIRGPKAFEEDDWDWIKIGSTVFRNVKPCTRCIMTTIDPENGTKHPKCEPLKTLKQYRQITDPEIRRHVGESPVMGIHLGLRGPSRLIQLGDPVFVDVTDRQESPRLTSPP